MRNDNSLPLPLLTHSREHAMPLPTINSFIPVTRPLPAVSHRRRGPFRLLTRAVAGLVICGIILGLFVACGVYILTRGETLTIPEHGPVPAPIAPPFDVSLPEIHVPVIDGHHVPAPTRAAPTVSVPVPPSAAKTPPPVDNGITPIEPMDPMHR